jgi:hypothetical protein
LALRRKRLDAVNRKSASQLVEQLLDIINRLACPAAYSASASRTSATSTRLGAVPAAPLDRARSARD